MTVEPGQLLLPPRGTTSSTRPLASENAGTTHSRQLHCRPCQAKRPTLAPHLGFGQPRRPSSAPSSSAPRIQESVSTNMCAQSGDSLSPVGVWERRNLGVARTRRHFLQRTSFSPGFSDAFCCRCWSLSSASATAAAPVSVSSASSSNRISRASGATRAYRASLSMRS